MKKLIIALVIVTLSWGWGLAEDRDDTYSERLGVYDWYYNNGMPLPDKLPKHCHWEYKNEYISNAMKFLKENPEWEPFSVTINEWLEEINVLIWLKRRVCD